MSLDQVHTFINGLIAQMMLRGLDRSACWAAGALEEDLRRYGG